MVAVETGTAKTSVAVSKGAGSRDSGGRSRVGEFLFFQRDRAKSELFRGSRRSCVRFGDDNFVVARAIGELGVSADRTAWQVMTLPKS